MDHKARKRDVRPVTINMERLSQHEREQLRSEDPDDGQRHLPMVRGECEDQDGPCPYVSCRYHLFLDIDPTNGSIKFNFPDLLDNDGTPRLELMRATCALNVANQDGATLEALGELLNLTTERARQLEVRALEKLRRKLTLIAGIDSHELTPTVGVFENPFTDGALD